MAISNHMTAVAAAVRAAPLPTHELGSQKRVVPFVTISREGGAGGHTVARRLVERLNEVDPGEEPWRVWDRELVEKVASDHHISRDEVASLGESHRNWLEEFVVSLSQSPTVDETAVFHRVAMTIRKLAQAGRVVIVGRGGAFITQSMPGGIHCRLVAPLDYRAQNMARQLGMPLEQATEHVKTLDRNRIAFHRRYWPNLAGKVDVFTVAFNTSLVTEDQAADSLLPLILPHLPRQ